MKATVRGFTMAYEDTGRGHPILLVHDWLLGRRIFDPQLRNLLGIARLVAPDLAGHGDSDPPAGPYGVARYAEDCLALLDARGITEPVIVCGLSMGGTVALELVLRFPERVAGLVLAATRAGPDGPAERAARDAQIRVAREQGTAPVVDATLPRMLGRATLDRKPKVVELARRTMGLTSVAGIVAALEAMRDRRDLVPELARIEKPALVVHGRDDALIPPAEGEALASGIRGAQLELVAGAGHLVTLEQPTAVNRAVTGFYRRVWAH